MDGCLKIEPAEIIYMVDGREYKRWSGDKWLGIKKRYKRGADGIAFERFCMNFVEDDPKIIRKLNKMYKEDKERQDFRRKESEKAPIPFECIEAISNVGIHTPEFTNDEDSALRAYRATLMAKAEISRIMSLCRGNLEAIALIKNIKD